MYFSGEVYGYVYANSGAEGNRGRTDVISTCSGNPPTDAWDPRTVNGRGGTNQIIYEDEVSGFACDFNDTDPVVDLYVFVQILERGGSTEVIGVPGTGDVCFRIESISPRPADTE